MQRKYIEFVNFMVSGRRATATWVVVDPGGGWFATLVLRGHVFSAVSLVSRWYVVAYRF